MHESYPERVARIARDHNISQDEAAPVARAEMRIEKRKVELKKKIKEKK